MVKLFLRRPRLESKVKGTIHICINTTKLEHKLYSNDIDRTFFLNSHGKEMANSRQSGRGEEEF